ncbi:3-ketoacyl-CoA reductase [Lactarius psammicola]|nr:3-ketoacyl-CoA reductase [Lactarius psammicola]
MTSSLGPFLSTAQAQMDAIPYLALGLQVFGALSLATAISRTLSFVFSNFVRPGISLKKFGANKGAWAVVTGASDGIGREFAIQLARAGFNVLLAARNQAKLDAVVADVAKTASGVQTKTFVIDFASADDARWEALLGELKPIEVGVLVNCVGVSHEFPTDFIDTSEEELNTDRRYQRFCHAAHHQPHRTRHGLSKGLILNMGSFAGASPTPMLAPKGITVEHVNAYFVISAMSKIRRPSLFIPTSKAFVRSVLAKLSPGTVTPYWSHALVGAVMALAPPKAMLAYVHSLQKDIRRRALAKQARLAKQE